MRCLMESFNELKLMGQFIEINGKGAMDSEHKPKNQKFERPYEGKRNKSLYNSNL